MSTFVIYLIAFSCSAFLCGIPFFVLMIKFKKQIKINKEIRIQIKSLKQHLLIRLTEKEHERKKLKEKLKTEIKATKNIKTKKIKKSI